MPIKKDKIYLFCVCVWVNRSNYSYTYRQTYRYSNPLTDTQTLTNTLRKIFTDINIHS